MLIQPKTASTPGIWINPDALKAVIPAFRDGSSGPRLVGYVLVLDDGRDFRVTIEVGEAVLASSKLG